MSGDPWFDRVLVRVARLFPGRGRHLRLRVDDRRLARLDRMRRARDRALNEGMHEW